jgi:hypothetical protein
MVTIQQLNARMLNFFNGIESSNNKNKKHYMKQFRRRQTVVSVSKFRNSHFGKTVQPWRLTKMTYLLRENFH